jgi:hypothetical protein
VKTWSVEAVYDYFWRSDQYTAQQEMIFTAGFDLPGLTDNGFRIGSPGSTLSAAE